MRRWLIKQFDRIREGRAQRKVDANNLLRARYHVFRSLLASNNRAVDSLTDISILLRLQGNPAGLVRLIKKLLTETAEMVGRLENLTQGKYQRLWAVQQILDDTLAQKLKALVGPGQVPFTLQLAKVSTGHSAQIGNKAAALADLKKKRRVPGAGRFCHYLGGLPFFS